jgi:hypothetical protein
MTSATELSIGEGMEETTVIPVAPNAFLRLPGGRSLLLSQNVTRTDPYVQKSATTSTSSSHSLVAFLSVR